jgi:hypothetical protein
MSENTAKLKCHSAGAGLGLAWCLQSTLVQQHQEQENDSTQEDFEDGMGFQWFY